MFGRIRLEFQCLERYGQNSNVWTDKIRIPRCGKNVWTDKVKIPMFGQIKSEFQ